MNSHNIEKSLEILRPIKQEVALVRAHSNIGKSKLMKEHLHIANIISGIFLYYLHFKLFDLNRNYANKRIILKNV